MKKIMSLLVICVVLLSCQQVQESQMQNIYDSVVDQQLKQWEIVNRSGSEAEKFVHAGIIAAAYLQAGNEEKYKEWNRVADSYNPIKPQ